MKKDELELDFKGLRTDNYSSTVPYMKNLTTDAKTLINRLPQNNVRIGLFQDSENHDMYKMFEKNSKDIDNNFSDTSPFVSSDIYNNLIQHQKGGGNSSSSSSSSSDSENSRGGGESDESTTSESDSESSNKNKNHKKSKKKSKSSETTDDDIAEQMLSNMYMSRESNTNTQTQSSKNSFISSSVDNHQSDSEMLSTISLNHKGRYYTESINTSDINIVSVDD